MRTCGLLHSSSILRATNGFGFSPHVRPAHKHMFLGQCYQRSSRRLLWDSEPAELHQKISSSLNAVQKFPELYIQLQLQDDIFQHKAAV